MMVGIVSVLLMAQASFQQHADCGAATAKDLVGKLLDLFEERMREPDRDERRWFWVATVFHAGSMPGRSRLAQLTKRMTNVIQERKEAAPSLRS